MPILPDDTKDLILRLYNKSNFDEFKPSEEFLTLRKTIIYTGKISDYYKDLKSHIDDGRLPTGESMLDLHSICNVVTVYLKERNLNNIEEIK